MITFAVQQAPTPKPAPAAVKRSRPQLDHAACYWQGEERSATSTKATMDLARILVAAGCPDQPWQAVGTDGQRRFFGNSLHRLATRTIEESSERGSVTEAVWMDVSQLWSRDSAASKPEVEETDAESEAAAE